MSLMLNHASLWKDSLLAIEVLAMARMLLYSMDQRESAYITGFEGCLSEDGAELIRILHI